MNRNSIEQCSFRKPIATKPGDANCGLLQNLLPTDDSEWSIVSEDACRACCASFAPTESDLNPVVASLLYGATESMLATEPENVDASACRRLHDWAEKSLPVVLPEEDESCPQVPTFEGSQESMDTEQIRMMIPVPANRTGPSVSDWAVGITTAPRRQPTLASCVRSIIAAGWSEPYMFVDGPADIPDSITNFPQTVRSPQIGAWPNYYQTLQDLLQLNPEADAYMIVQDDVLFPASSMRPYVEQILWPGTEPCLVSLYCCSDYTTDNPGWFALNETWKYGALAFIYPRDLALAFLQDDQVRNYVPGKKKAGIDAVIGDWATRHRVPVFRSTPSIVQHIGHVSAIWDTSRAIGLRRASNYLGDCGSDD